MDVTADDLIQRLDSALILVSECGDIVFSNESAERLFGRRLVGSKMVPSEFTEATPLSLSVAEAYERLVHESQGGELVADGTGDSASYYWLQVSQKGSAGDFLLTLHDVSDVLARSGALARVLSQVSHDLRSPLTSVGGAAELLLSGRTGELPDNHKRMINIIDEGARKMEAILVSAKKRYSVQTAEAGEEES